MDANEMQSLRAFLQRAETRLATMHAMAGAFIGGAGLLTLLPIFYRDIIGSFFRAFVDDAFSVRDWTSAITLLWILPISCSLWIPGYALVLLIRQLVIFYFVPHGDEGRRHVLPRLALGALAAPLDDPPGSKLKATVIVDVYRSDNILLAVPSSATEADRQNLASMARDFPHLVQDVITERLSARQAYDGSHHDIGDAALAYDVRSALAGLRDRTLSQEAARIEVALVRANTQLRVMLLRYVKSLLCFIWTIVILLSGAAVLDFVEKEGMISLKGVSVRSVVCLDLGLVWAALTPRIVALPIDWIRQLANLHSFLMAFRADLDLVTFENNVYRLAVSSSFACLAGIAAMLLQSLKADWPVEYVATLFFVQALFVGAGIALLAHFYIFNRR